MSTLELLASIDARIAQRDHGTNVLRVHIAKMKRLIEVRAAFYLMGAEATSLWND
jgi:hypothetical protein